ncbi:MAG: hypothetical protein ACREA7_04055 [Nitrosotalea sp.]
MTYEWAFLVTGLTLIAMGLRHALDVDHITAIDMPLPNHLDYKH